MLAELIHAEDWEIDPRLQFFGVTRLELVKVALAVVAARADKTDNDPGGAEGQLAYIYGTRNTCALFRTKGWNLHRQENIQSVCHPTKDLRVVYQSVDLAARRIHRPQAISGKGSGSDRFIDVAQGDLFTEEQLSAPNLVKLGKIDAGLWYFCVSVNGDDVCAELSLPTCIKEKNFQGFIERIFIIRPGEWSKLVAKPKDDATEFEPFVTRKK
jgi:hypothetical protein